MTMEHSGAITALLYLPILIVAGAMALDHAATRLGNPSARWLLEGIRNASAARRGAALLMIVSATVHLALVPDHWSEQPVTAVLFVLDGAALALVAAALLYIRRPAIAAVASGLLATGIVVYGGYLLTGLETADPVGVITKIAELAAVGLLLETIPLRRFATL